MPDARSEMKHVPLLQAMCRLVLVPNACLQQQGHTCVTSAACVLLWYAFRDS